MINKFAAPRERLCELHPERLYGPGCLSSLELTSHLDLPQVLNRLLQDLMFSLLSFGLVLVQFFSSPFSSLFKLQYSPVPLFLGNI